MDKDEEPPIPDPAGARQDVRPLLKRFDVYVCTSKAESSPISVWEAMSMAKPIVSTDVGDVSLYIKNGENGFIVPVEDNLLLAKCVQKIIDNLEKYKINGSISRLIVKKELDLKHCAEKNYNTYRIIKQLC